MPTNTAVDVRPKSSADALWDGSHLFVVSAAVDLSTAGTPPSTGDLAIRLLRYSYDASTSTYALDQGFPVTLANAAVEAAVIDEDGTGVVWATWTYLNGSGGRSVLVTHSAPGGAQWVTPYVLPVTGANNLTFDDISALVRYNGRIGVMWSNQNAGAINFATHADGDGDQVWDVNPAVQGPHYADDHISIRSLQADPSGRVVAVVKTSLGDVNPGSQQPQILMLVLDRNGGWKRTTFGVVTDDHTRPIVVVDSENSRAYIFATGPRNTQTINGVATFGGTIYYKSTSLANPSFAPGLGTPFMRLGASSTSLLNDPTSTKQAVDSSTGLLVLASDDGARQYMDNRLVISPRVQSPPTASDSSITVTQGQTASGLLTATDADGDPLTYSIVTNGGKGTATITNAATGAYQYVPGTGALGPDSFTFKANDGIADSNVATITISIVSGSGGTRSLADGRRLGDDHPRQLGPREHRVAIGRAILDDGTKWARPSPQWDHRLRDRSQRACPRYSRPDHSRRVGKASEGGNPVHHQEGRFRCLEWIRVVSLHGGQGLRAVQPGQQPQHVSDRLDDELSGERHHLDAHRRDIRWNDDPPLREWRSGGERPRPVRDPGQHPAGRYRRPAWRRLALWRHPGRRPDLASRSHGGGHPGARHTLARHTTGMLKIVPSGTLPFEDASKVHRHEGWFRR